MVTARRRVLVVDDEVPNRELMYRVLKRDYDVAMAADVASAIAALERADEPFGAILCDQQMPGGLGTELAVVVRRRWPMIAFVLVTGHDDSATVVTARDCGLLASVIAKPWAIADLRAEVVRALAAPAYQLV